MLANEFLQSDNFLFAALPLPSADDGVCARDGVAEMRADEAEPCSDDFSVLSSCCSRRISASFFNDSTCERSFAISAS